MASELDEAARLFRITPIAESEATEVRARVESALGTKLPDAVAAVLRFPGLMEKIVDVYDAQLKFPHEPALVEEGDLPGTQEPALWLMTENQGVCMWGVPLRAGEDPPVLVGGDLMIGSVTVEFASSIGAFALAMAWDHRAMRRTPLIQAQAGPLDSPMLAFLRTRFREGVVTKGWPGADNFRFQGQNGLQITLWSAAEGCDWWLCADDEELLRSTVGELMEFSDLRESFWSNDPTGEALLKSVRGAR